VAASDNFILGQELVYTFAEFYPNSSDAEAAFAKTSTEEFRQCMIESDATSTGVKSGPPLTGWESTRFLFQPVLANTTYSYFDPAVRQQNRYLLFVLSRKRGGEFPLDVRESLAKAMVSHASAGA
jgi:hypothetical protein